MMFTPGVLQNAITYSAHIYKYLQSNIEGRLFLLYTKRLNSNLRKKIEEQI